MKKHSMPEMKEGGVNVTPLIDVVMCLIIFFMLVAKIGVSTGAKAMELPQTIAGKKIEELGDSIVLNVYDPTIVSGSSIFAAPVETPIFATSMKKMIRHMTMSISGVTFG